MTTRGVQDKLNQPGPQPYNLKRMNMIFTVTFAVLSAFIISAAFWGVSIESFDQLAALGFTVALASGLILCNVEGNRHLFEKGVFRITQGFRVFVVLTSLLSLLTAWVPAYNLINVLVNQCPQFDDGLPNVTLVLSLPHNGGFTAQDTVTLTQVEAFKICRTEQGYAIALIIVCFVIMILDLITAIVYSVVVK